MLNDIIPSNNHVNRIEPDNLSFNLSEEPFDLRISLWIFYSYDDVFDSVLIQELSKRVSGILSVPSRHNRSSVVYQDLARNSMLSEALINEGDGIFHCWRIEYPVTRDQPR